MIVSPKPLIADPADAAVGAAASGFEAIFVRMMLKSMREASLGGGLLDGDGSQSFRDLQDSTVADAVAKRGLLGFGRHIEAFAK